MWKIQTTLPMQIAIIEMEEVEITDDQNAFVRLTQCAGEYAAKYKNSAIGEIEGVRVARRLFKAIGIDPTKHRPSSEALLNRALKGKELYAVNSLVDVGNWCSLEFLLPICIYDADKIIGSVTIRLGEEDDTYIGLNEQPVNLHQRYVIADEFGAFGSPMTDSKRTAVDLKTHRAILGIFAPEDFDPELLTNHATRFAHRVQEFCGGDVQHIYILSQAHHESHSTI